MKKLFNSSKPAVIGLILGLSTLCTIGFTGCKNQTDNDDSNKQIKLEDVKDFFIINPTNQTKRTSEQWFSIQTQSRSVENQQNQDNDYIEHTRPFTTEILSASELKKLRAADTTIRYKKFKENEKHTFNMDIDEDYNTQRDIVRGTMVHAGKHCYIWIIDNEDPESLLSKEEYEAFADNFDKIYEKETALCGPKYDGTSMFSYIITPNDKISIVLHDIGNNKSTGRWFGYFSSICFMNNQDGQNAIEAIFVDSYYAKQESNKKKLYSTLTHEFNHMLNYVNKTLKYGKYMSPWYTELLSMITEDFFMEDLNLEYSDSPQSRLESFIVKGRNYGFGNWNNEDSASVGYKYANAYAFGAYLARNYGGAELIHEIATNEYVDEESVIKAVNKINGTNKTFNDLIKEFPEILLNTDGSNFPSLNRTYSGKIKDCEYNFSLSSIDLSNLRDGLKIKPDNINDAPAYRFDPYGFLYFHFDENTDVNLNIKDCLLINY